MKKLLSIALLLLLLVGGYTFAAQKRVRNANPFSVFQAIKVTSNGSLTGTCFFEANSGVVSDCNGNQFLTGVNLSGYITGYTETDPIRNSVSGNYVPYSGATQNLYLANNNIIFDQGNMGGIIFSSGGSTFDGSTIMSFANNQLSFAGPDYGVNFDMSLLNSNITAYFPPVSGTFLFDTTLSGYLTGYIPRANIDTGFNNTGSDTIIPSEKAVWGLMDGLTDTYIPYRSGDRFYNSSAFFSGDRLNLGGFDMVLNYPGVALTASGSAYFDGDNVLGGFSIPVLSGVGMFGWAEGTGRAAGYLQTSSNAYGLRVDSNSRGDAAAINVDTLFGPGVEIDTLDAIGISINKIFSAYTGVSTALVVGYSGFSNMSVDYSGNISTIGNFTVNNGVDIPFRFAYSGGLMEGQYYTGGVWTTATIFTP